jgi:hypothetical protein
MPDGYESKITHVRGLNFSPFSSEEMAAIGEAGLKSILHRIFSAKDVNDAPARPLVDGYAARKLKHGRFPIRDWNWTGGTLRSIKVKSASEMRVVLGPTDARSADMIYYNNRRCKQWPASPTDLEAIHQAIADTFVAHLMVDVSGESIGLSGGAFRMPLREYMATSEASAAA